MKTQELKFIEQNILNLLENNKSSEISVILDYLDYINKIKYSEAIIKPILDNLVLRKKIKHEGIYYSLC